MATHAVLEFPGLEEVQSVTFTLNRGVAPSLCQVVAVPNPRLVAERGDLVIHNGEERIVFRDCALDRGSLDSGGGGQQATLYISDRRWKWQFGKLFGNWNLRDAEGVVIPRWEKKPSELLLLIFAALNEENPDLEDVDDNVLRPDVFWDETPPAQALRDLLGVLNMDVVLGLDDRVKVVRIGKGDPLPEGNDVRTVSLGVDPAARPDAIEVQFQPNLYQEMLALEAVGLDLDGEVKPLAKLSYSPDGGWAGQDPLFFWGVEQKVADWEDAKAQEAMSLADRTAWRWYRVTGGPQGNDVLIANGVIAGPEDLVILPQTLMRERQADGTRVPISAIVRGVWWPGGSDKQNTPANGSARYHGDFTLDEDRRMVQFPFAVTKLNAAGQETDADLWLETAFMVRDGLTNTLLAHSVVRRLNNAARPSPPKIIYSDPPAEGANVFSGRRPSKAVQGDFEPGRRTVSCQQTYRRRATAAEGSVLG